MSIFHSWQIEPSKTGNLGECDYRLGFRHYDDGEPMLDEENSAYMAGWYSAKGCADGYAGKEPDLNVPRQCLIWYNDSYQDATYEKTIRDGQ